MKNLILTLLVLTLTISVSAQKKIIDTIETEESVMEYNFHQFWKDSDSFSLGVMLTNKENKEKTLYLFSIQPNSDYPSGYVISGGCSSLKDKNIFLMEDKNFPYDPIEIKKEQVEDYIKNNFTI